MQGGDGQPGGKGRPGTKGNDMEARSFPGGFNDVVYVQEGDDAGKEKWIYGRPAAPGPGNPAVISGNPGDGGGGGNLTTNADKSILNYVSQDGGSAGPQGEGFSGGPGGNPRQAFWLKIRRFCKRWERNPRPNIGERLFGDTNKLNSFSGNAVRTGFVPGTTASPAFDCAEWGDKYEAFRGPFISSDGLSVGSPPAGKSGARGAANFVPTDSGGNAWLHPEALRAVIDHAKDQYLNGHLEEAQKSLQPYADLLAGATPGTLPAEYSLQLEQQRLEIESLLQRLASNLDYFGNPAGYVPLLSLQANLRAYENEVNSAIPILYMTYWLGKKADDVTAKQAALTQGIQSLAAEIANDRIQYNSRLSEIGQLQVDAENISTRMQIVQEQLTRKEAELIDRADRNIKDRNRLPFWKTALRTLSAISKVVPVYQPVLGVVGAGLDVITNIDTNAPLDSLNQLGNVASQINQASLKESSIQLDEQLRKIDPTNASGAKAYVQGVIPFAKKIAEAQRAVRSVTAQSQAPKTEVDAELLKIKNADPEFTQLVTDVENLNSLKTAFSLRAAQNLQEVANLSEGVGTKLLAIDAMNNDLAAASASLSPTTKMYLKEVERRAKERLLKYHYYLAKAYEYRMIQPYPGNLTLNSQFENLITLASRHDELKGLTDVTKHSVSLSAEEFSRLRGVYEEPLRVIISDMMKQYNTNRAERSDEFTYTLTQGELDQLNANGRTVINLQRAGMLRPTEENQRLVKVSALEIAARPTGTTGDVDDASVKLTFLRSARSFIRSGSKAFFFNFPDEPFWETTYDVNRRRRTDVPTSVDATSLLKTLMEKTAFNPGDAENILLFSRPSALGDLTVSKSVLPVDTGANIVVERLVLGITYDYYRVKNDQQRAMLDVQVAPGMSPHISIDTVDQTGLTDGKGDFSRFYPAGIPIRLEAEPTFGGLVFYEWREGGRWNGATLTGGTSLGQSTELRLIMTGNKVIRAVYGPPR
jgi:hypothetical protein